MAGQTYQFDMLASATSDGTLADPFASLRSGAAPADTIVSSDDGGIGDNSRFTYQVPVGQGGTYLFVAQGASVLDTGTYSLSVSNISPVDDYPNNDLATNGTIAIGDSSTGDIETDGDTDWFKVTLMAGQTYQFDMLASATSAGTLTDPFASLRSGTAPADTIVSSDDGGIGDNSRFTYQVPVGQGGTYLFVAQSASVLDTGTYRVSVSNISPVDDYPNNDLTTDGTIAIGGSALGDIETDGDTDWFKVTLVAGQTYQFDMLASASSDGTLADPFASLRGGGGPATTIVSSDDGGGGNNSRFTYQVPVGQGGTYLFVAQSASVLDTGTYRVSVSNISPVDDLPNNDLTTDGTIAIGGSSTGDIETNGDTDWFKVLLVSGRTYQFDMLASATGDGTLIDPYGSLRIGTDPAGMLVASDDGGIGDNSRFTWQVPEGQGGTYLFVAQAASVGDTGTYRVAVADVTSDSLDTTDFLTGGGSIEGIRNVPSLQFGGGVQWLLDAASTLTATGTAGVSVGSGLLSLTAGASLISQGSTDTVSDSSLQGAAVTVTGPGAIWRSSGDLLVGDTDPGALAIETAGAVNVGGDLIVAKNTAAAGSSISVSGGNSSLAITGSLVIGGAGYGSLSLALGASVTVGSLDLASGASGDGVVSVVGVGTSLNVLGSLVVGDQSTGEMSILGGAVVTIGGGLIGGAGGEAGNLDVEGAGSHLVINGGTLVVGATGPAVYTLGQGTTQTGAERTAVFGIANLGGLQDPPYITNDSSQSTLNSGYVGEADIAVRNSGTYTVKPQSGTFAPPTVYSPDITFDPDPNTNGGSTNGVWVIQNLGTLVLNATTVDASQTIDFVGVNAAKLVIGQVPGNNGTLDVDNAPIVDGSIPQDSPNVLTGFSAPIQNYQSGDVIVLRGLTYGSATASGDVVTVWSGAAGTGTALGSLVFLDKKGNDTGVTVVAEALAASVQLTAAAVACFAAGTRIETPEGTVRVEELRVGDLVLTADGRHEPVVWLGSRAINCKSHPKPETVWPVRINAGAFGEHVPCRDLFLSPDHAVFVGGVLIPVKLLINGTTISQMKRKTVTYYHVELPEHAVILAEGLTVESYLDSGDRANFSNAGATVRLFPEYSVRPTPETSVAWEARGAAPLVLAGRRLTAARAAVATASPHSRPSQEAETRAAGTGRRRLIRTQT